MSAWEEVLAEKRRQVSRWKHFVVTEVDPDLSRKEVRLGLAAIGDEFREAFQAFDEERKKPYDANGIRYGQTRKELVQLAALALRLAEDIYE